jgi:GNAT superfamily N-acetyltransferase
MASYTGPGSPLNKIAGLGFAGPVDEAALAEIERMFHDRGEPAQVELSSLAEPSVAPLLTRRGYVLYGFENVSGLDPAGSTTRIADGVEVSPSPDAELSDWLSVVVRGFAAPDGQGVTSHESFADETLERVIGDMAGAEGFERYLARRDGVPVGGGSMRVSGKVAQLCGAATLPGHRRRGVQASLLAARLETARRAGCEVAVVTTQPGSTSQRNVHRRGFDLLYTRAVLVLAPAQADTTRSS